MSIASQSVAIAVAAFALTIVAVIVHLALRHERLRAAAVDSAWRDFGRRSGWRFRPADGPWYRRRAARLEGDLAGAPGRLEQQVVHNGKSTKRYTRYLVHLPVDVAVPFEIESRTFAARLKSLGRRKVATGEARFDALFLLRAPKDEVRELFDDALKLHLSAFPKALEVRARGRELTLRWHGAESDARTLDAGSALLTELCRAVARG